MAELFLEGTLFRKMDTQKVSDKFQKREFIIETSENYPQKVKFELTQDRCDRLDSHREGDKIKVHFNVRGSEWQGKFYVNLQAWKIDKLDGSAPSGDSGSHSSSDAFSNSTVSTTTSSSEDDLPF